MVKLFAAVLVTAVVMIVVFQFVDPKVEKPGGNAATSLVDDSNTTSGTLSCSISGEVKRSGTYVLEENTTLDDFFVGIVLQNSGVSFHIVTHPVFSAFRPRLSTYCLLRSSLTL